MKSVIALSLGLFVVAAIPLQSAVVREETSPYLIRVNDQDQAANRILPGGTDLVRPATPSQFLAGGQLVTTNGGTPVALDSQLNSMAGIGPITQQGPLPAPVPEPGSSVLFLLVGAVGLVALRRQLRRS